MNKTKLHCVLMIILFLIPSISIVRSDLGGNTKEIIDSFLEFNLRPHQSLEINLTYNLLIISPSEYIDLLEPLAAHKQRHNIRTITVTLPEIYESNYFPVQGRDNPEKIKYFIKNALEQWNIKYVLLIGDNQTMPVRYTHLYTRDDPFRTTGYISDLYYADIYRFNSSSKQYEFEDWDSSGNGIFAEWTSSTTDRDILDLYPDVAVGRLPCKSRGEVRTVVGKIIDYDEQTYGSEWFYRMIVCGGDTDKEGRLARPDTFEGELITGKALEYMNDFSTTTLWASKRNLNKNTINKAISNGAGFVYFSGHGDPGGWITYGPYFFWRLRRIDYDNQEVFSLTNGEKLPIMIFGGCSISEFDYKKECMSWRIMRINTGGAIATLGYTAGCYGASGDENKNGIPDCIEMKSGYLELQLFKRIGQNNITVLGDAMKQALIDYLHTFPINWSEPPGASTGNAPYNTQQDCQIVEKWILFGDPSLKIGGYPT